MAKSRKTISMHNPFPVAKRGKKADWYVDRIDIERKEAIKGLEHVVPPLDLMEQYLCSPLGIQRDKWLKSNGWIEAASSGPEILASYQCEITKHQIRILKDQSIIEDLPNETTITHQSWKDFIEDKKQKSGLIGK